MEEEMNVEKHKANWWAWESEEILWYSVNVVVNMSVVVNTSKWITLVFMRGSVSCSWHCELQCHSPAQRNKENTTSNSSSSDRCFPM